MSESFRVHTYAAVKTRKQKRDSKTSRVHKVTVEPVVWKTAVQIANGNIKRIKIISPTEVVVKNDLK